MNRAFVRSKLRSVRDIVKHFQRIRLGYGVEDRLRILEITILFFLASFLPRKSRLWLNERVRQLFLQTVVQVDGIRFFLVDLESLWIVSHDFERFMSTWLKPQPNEVAVDVGHTLENTRCLWQDGLGRMAL